MLHFREFRFLTPSSRRYGRQRRGQSWYVTITSAPCVHNEPLRIHNREILLYVDKIIFYDVMADVL